MEDRNIQFLFQPLFDLKAFGRSDVLQVDAAEYRCDPTDCFDDLLGILGVQTDRESIHISEPLEQQRFSLHNRHGCLSADIAQSQYRRTITDHRNQIALGCISVGQSCVPGDLQTGLCHTGSIGQAQILGSVHLHLAIDTDFTLMLCVKAQRFFSIIHSCCPFLILVIS